jgi:acyl-coenzyme A synthetase/AMP-(fatty) acid ligase
MTASVEFSSISRLMISDRPKNTVVAYLEGRERNFGQFQQDIAATLQKLKAGNIRKVVLATADSYSYCGGFFAALHQGCRIIIPPNVQPGMLEKFVTPDCPLLSEKRIERLQHQIDIGGEVRTDHPFAALSPDTSFLDFYTSGSTGTPKRVSKTLAQIENELIVLENTWKDQLDNAVTLGTVTHQHIFGLYFKTLWPLCAGRPFFSETFEIWEELLAVAPSKSCFISSPAHLSRIPPIDPLGADGPEMIFSAGGPLSTEAAHDARHKFGPLPTEVFGSTETGGVASRQQETAKTPFRPLGAMETRIDSAGLLSVRSNYTDGADWCETNDIAQRFEDGSFLLAGRANQFVKIEGKRISLAEVEKYLREMEVIRDVAVFILENGSGPLAAVVELSEEGWAQHRKMGPFRLNRHLRSKLHDNLEHAAMPRRWRFIRQIPTNSQGKRLQTALEQLFD